MAALGLALAAIGSDARAQAPPSNAPPPGYSEIDGNGVDLASGQLNLGASAVSVGAQGDGLARLFIGRGLRDNLTGTIQDVPNPITGFPDAELYYVSLGGSSAVFLRKTPTAAFLPYMNASGETLVLNGATNVYTYTASDGTTATFDGNLYLQTLGTTAPVTVVNKPGWERLTYTYASSSSQCAPVACVRLQAVTSSLGYMIKYQYGGAEPETGSLTLTKVTAINLAYDYCDPAAASCTTTNTWSSMSFAGVEFGSGTFTMTDSLNRVTTYTLASNRVTQIVSPGGVTTTIAYNVDGRVQSVASPAGTWTYAYVTLAGNKLQTTVTDPLSHSRVVVSDGVFHRMLSHTDAANNTTTFLYDWDNDGRLTQVTLPEGNYTVYGYDTRSNVTSVTRYPKPGSNLPAYVTTAVYPTTCTYIRTCNQPTSVTDGGATTDYTYDNNHGGVLTVTEPAGASGIRPQSRYVYGARTAQIRDAAGALVAAPTGVVRLLSVSQCATTASCPNTVDEMRFIYTYGAPTGAPNNLRVTNAQVITQGAAVSSSTTYAYNPEGDVVSTDGPLASPILDTTARFYNSERQLLGEIGIDPDGFDTGRPALARRYTYNLDGQPTQVETGYAASQTAAGWAGFVSSEQLVLTYDSAGRKVRESLAGGGTTQAVTQYSYDGASRTECVATRMNASVFGSLPASACSLGAEGADGPDRITKYGYDAADRPTTVTQAFGTSAPRVASTTTYRPNGQVETLADGKGNLTTYVYDAFDRLSRTNFPGTADYAELTYDNTTWNVIQDRRRDGQLVGYTYDARHRVTAQTAPAVTYGYDQFDRLRTATEGGQTVTYVYDGIGRLTSTTSPQGTVTYANNLAYQRTKLTWPDTIYVDYALDWTGAVTAIKQQGGVVVAGFTYDNLGRRATLTRSNGVVTTYGYDAVSRLQTLTQDLASTANDETLTFGYNAAGQIKSRTSTNTAYAWNGLYNVSKPYTANGLNQVTAIGAQATTHDARGNLTSDGVTTFSYDVDNRLTGTSGGATLGYDPVGRLGQITSSGGTVTKFLYDGTDLIGEFDAAGAVLRRYVHGPGVDEPLVWYEGSTGWADRRWLIADNQGSTVAVTNGSGASMGLLAYDEHGVAQTGQSVTPRFQYTGQAWIPEVGLYHYKARAYSPTLGRFMQTDPIGYAAGMNMYGYVGGDPVNGTDPMGLCPHQTGSRICLPRDRGPTGNNGPDGGVGAGGAPAPGGTVTFTPWETTFIRLSEILPTSVTFSFNSLRSAEVGTSQSDEWEEARNCAARARILQGNSRHIGRVGAFPGHAIQRDNAAVIPDQWGGRAAVAGNLNGYSARLENGTQVFRGVGDVVGGQPPRGTRPGVGVRDALRERFPGQLIIELPGGRDGGSENVVVTVPDNQVCPAGTTEVGAG